MSARWLAALLALVLAGGPTSAAKETPPGSQIVLSDKYARPTIINTYFPEAPPLQPAPIDGAAFAAEFKRLCLDTGFSAPAFESAAGRSPFGLAKVAMTYPGARGVPAFNIDGWYGRSASARLWTGDSRALRRLPFMVIDAGVMITGPQTPPVPQCNLDVASSALTDWGAILSAFDAALGSPGRGKGSRKWAQASWSLPVPTGKIVIGLRIDDLHKPAQTAHVGAVFSEKAD